MSGPKADWLEQVSAGCAVIDQVMKEAHVAQERAELLVKRLHALVPDFPVMACALHALGNTSISVSDTSAKPRPGWAEELAAEFARHPKAAGDARAAFGDFPQAASVGGHSLLAEEIDDHDRSSGFLALAFTGKIAADSDRNAHAVLRTWCRFLAVHLERERQQARAAEQAWLADVGELAGPLAHEFNNVLNTVLLHVAVLQYAIPENLRPDLAEIHKQCTATGRLVKQFQQLRHDWQLEAQRADLNHVVREALAVLDRERDGRGGITRTMEASAEAPRSVSERVVLELAPDLTPVCASHADLTRLIVLLIRNSLLAAPTAAKVKVRSQTVGDKLVLEIEDPGPPVPAETLALFFEPGVQARNGTRSLELAACKSLLRRIHGTIRCENPPNGGFAVIVTLPRAKF
jgi:signal transduction histidine kinase